VLIGAERGAATFRSLALLAMRAQGESAHEAPSAGGVHAILGVWAGY
jgi:hypothetical protein